MLAILQASLQSQRFPSKVMQEIEGIPMVLVAARRIRKAKCVSDLVVSVPLEPLDNPLAAMLQRRGYRVIRAVPKHQTYNLLPVIEKAGYAGRWFFRFTADNPCVDPALVDAICEEAWQDVERAQVYLTRSDRLEKNSYPNGYDVELINGKSLQNGIGYNPAFLHWRRLPCPIVISDISLTVDTPQDLVRVKSIFALCDGNPSFARLARVMGNRHIRPVHHYSLGDFWFLRCLRNQIGSGHISFLQHGQWWYGGGWRKCFILCVGGRRVGYVRESPLREVSIAVHPAYQHLGLGLFLLQSLPPGDVPRYVYVKWDNVASLALFRKAGWEQQDLGSPASHGFVRFQEAR